MGCHREGGITWQTATPAAHPLTSISTQPNAEQLMQNEKPTEKQRELVDSLTDLILEHSIEDLLNGVATICRMGEELHKNSRDYPRAGTYAHYAHTIEQLFEE